MLLSKYGSGSGGQEGLYSFVNDAQRQNTNVLFYLSREAIRELLQEWAMCALLATWLPVMM